MKFKSTLKITLKLSFIHRSLEHFPLLLLVTESPENVFLGVKFNLSCILMLLLLIKIIQRPDSVEYSCFVPDLKYSLSFLEKKS